MRQRVLIVDDDRLVADTLRMVFAANGFQSEACYSAAEALGRARSFDPELMLCDVSMPGESGLELAATITREMPRTKVIMLTAYLSSSASMELDELRLEHSVKVLSKPCPPEVLLKEVEDSLSMPWFYAAS